MKLKMEAERARFKRELMMGKRNINCKIILYLFGFSKPLYGW